MKAVKKIILLALASLMMMACTEESAQPIEIHEINTYIVDSCEYIGRSVYNQSGILAHKGDCRFCAKRRKQELKELVKQIKEK